MAMGTTPAPEHDAPAVEQLRTQWPSSEFETPEQPAVEGREVQKSIEKREE